MILPDGRVWTYGDVEHASARMANLIVELGLQPGDRVAAQVEKTPEALVLYLAAMRAGMVFLPLNPAYQRHELGISSTTRSRASSSAGRRCGAGARARRAAGVPLVLDLDDAGTAALIDAATPHADASPRCESRGQRPRRHPLHLRHHRPLQGRDAHPPQPRRQRAGAARILGLPPGDVLLHMLPTFHVHGLFVATHCALLNGSPMLFEPKFDARAPCA
jgi:malonyl-CoA/methylmalonyl-CoA synthetase